MLQAQDDKLKALRKQLHETEGEMEQLKKELQLEQQIAKVRSHKSLCGLSNKVNIAGLQVPHVKQVQQSFDVSMITAPVGKSLALLAGCWFNPSSYLATQCKG